MSSTTAQTFDRAQIRRNLDDFTAFWLTRVQGWRENKETATEKKYAQQFWTELFNCFGVNAARMDLFEQDARRSSTGGTGYIDLFWPGVVIGEAKSLGVDLDIAHEQARDYLTGGSVSDFELPRYILCSNFETLRLSRLGDPDTRFDITFPLSDISDHIDQLRFLAGYETVTKKKKKKRPFKPRSSWPRCLQLWQVMKSMKLLVMTRLLIQMKKMSAPNKPRCT